MTRNIEESRSESTRETEQRSYEDYTFEEPDYLAIPDSVKDRFANQQMSLRWVRISIKGRDDIQNVGKRIQDGWVFVTPDEVPEIAHNSFVKDEGRYSGTVCRGDLALAKIPTGKAKARQAFYENRSREMMDAVNSQLQSHQDSRMPISNASKSQVVKGRLPTFQD
jgi:hypothetical protein|tara:strand:+ start:1136 stop:1633 length:498 start_codon:yes stop_codon:yes gene_type:complete